MRKILMACTLSLGALSCAILSGGPQVGAADEASGEQLAAMKAMGQRACGRIVWASSRFGNHDIFSMALDGSQVRRLTASEHVDWFPRFSPDGRLILFTRSYKGWVSERDANQSEKWALFTMTRDGENVTKVADRASWGSWLDNERIIFVRDTKVIIKNLIKNEEMVFLDADATDALAGLVLQQPELSPDGRFLALTLRGGRRETGVWNSESKTWVATGKGCQINWFPSGERILWVNPSGNGGSEVFSMEMSGGKPAREYSYDEMRFVDIPGRRSHEYFPQLSDDGRFLVWAATQRGHDHDVADYEIYVWEVGTPAEQATRLTFHSGNDRWPDISLDPSGEVCTHDH